MCVLPDKCEAGAGLLVGEEVALVVVAPGDAVVARHYCNLLPSLFSHLDKVCSGKFYNLKFINKEKKDKKKREHNIVMSEQFCTLATFVLRFLLSEHSSCVRPDDQYRDSRGESSHRF